MGRFKHLPSTFCAILAGISLLGSTGAETGGTSTNSVRVRIPPGEAHPWLSAEAPETAVVTIEQTPDFHLWSELLRGHGSFVDVPDLSPTEHPHRFYRARVREKTDSDDWKNVLAGAADPFRSPESPSGKRESRWIKFALRLNAPHQVVFQDSTKYPFHYDFAVERLPEFKGLSRTQFDSITLRTKNQAAVLGAVLFAPTDNLAEAGIQFVGFDPYPRESVAGWFQTVRAMLGLDPATRVFYLPTFEQRDAALANADWFAARGIQVGSAARWAISDEVYAPGWALGRLVFVPGDQIAAAYRNGTLKPDDVLITDAVPAEVPPLAGIISLHPATPNSHVALLAKSFGIPFVYVADPGFAEAAMTWVGRELLVRAVEGFEFLEVAAVPLAAELPAEIRDEIAALKVPPRLDIPPKASLGRISIPTDGLAPPDIRFVGGKAANFGILRRSVPTNSPSPAIALSFDLWDAYLDQVLDGGRTLRAAIQARLAGFSWPPNMAALQTALAEVRDLITDEADFSPEQKAALLTILQSAGFDPNRNIRFRSSTNVEDGDQFSGAGLYDSYSGCLADDLDGDTAGPSVCDPEETRERGVFRALRKVFASFYNDNAFLERLRHGVDESTVGMGVLVHYSTPDPFELANGVATLQIRNYESGTWMITTRLVSQLGAVSVTNPDVEARPEEVEVIEFSSSSRPSPSIVTRSSLVQLGGTVLEWEKEYQDLYALLKAAALQWQAETGTNEIVTLDFEYKKEVPGRLSVKQIRTVPLPEAGERIPPYLIGTTNRYAVFQGELGDVVANHRLKSLWGFTTRHLHLTETNRIGTLFSTVEGVWLDGTNSVEFSGSPETLPGYSFTRELDHTSERWAMGSGADRREFELRVFDIPEWTMSKGPLVLLQDHQLELRIQYEAPQPTIQFDEFAITNTTVETVWLAPITPVTGESKLQHRTLKNRRFEISTSYYWPREPGGAGAGYTAPAIAWAGTTITGLTSRPIQLNGEFSQTYRPGHHNIWEDYLFDPWLEPGIDPQLLAELARLNVRAIIVRRGLPATPVGGVGASEFEDIFLFWGLDGQFRRSL